MLDEAVGASAAWMAVVIGSSGGGAAVSGVGSAAWGLGVAEGVLGSQRALWGRARERKGVVEDGMGERLELRCRFQMGLLIRRFPFDGSSMRACSRALMGRWGRRG